MQMRLYLGIVRNKDSQPQVEELLKFLDREGFASQVTYYDTDFPISYKEFTPGKWGLDNIKEKVRGVVPARSQNVVFFFYEQKEEMATCAWTYPGDLYSKEAF